MDTKVKSLVTILEAIDAFNPSNLEGLKTDLERSLQEKFDQKISTLERSFRESASTPIANRDPPTGAWGSPIIDRTVSKNTSYQML